MRDIKTTRGTREQRQARYAAKDVIDKFGIKPGLAVCVVGSGERELLAKVKAKTGRVFVNARQLADIVLYFPKRASEIIATLKNLKTRLVPNGGIWVITAKKNQGEPYIPDQILIPLGLAAGLVDNKICSVSETHSAMRFVIRRAERSQ